MLKRMTLALVVLFSFAMVSACDLIFLVLTVTNDSPVQICEIYVSSSDAYSWGSDELGNQTLDPGERFDLLLVNGTYDLKFVDCVGEEGQVNAIDLYEDTQISYSY